jgi:plastocyanin
MSELSFNKAFSYTRIRIIGGILVLVLLVLAILLSLSSALAKSDHPAAPKAVNDTTDVTIIDFSFQPNVVTITVGSSVRWTNTGVFTHTSTSDTGVWDSGDIGPGKAFIQTFNTPGTYPYHCMHHPTIMKGTVVVLTKLFAPIMLRE